jgi:hypothetical protein
MTFSWGVELRQLVLIATAWRTWRLDDDVSLRGVDRLVRAMLGRTAPPAGGAVEAWLATTADGAASATSWTSGDRAHQDAETFIDRLADPYAMDGVERERQITGTWIRVLCGPDRTEAVFRALGADGRAGLRHWTALDVRFVSDRSDKFQIHLGFSFWAVRPPWHPPAAGARPRLIEPAVVPSLRETFERRAAAARSLVDKHLGPTTTLVWSREHAPPMFWVVTLARPRKDLSRYLADPGIAERLVRPLLDRGPMDDGVAASVIDGDLLALRHFRPERTAHDQVALRPVYLLLRGRQRRRPAGGGEPEDYRHQQVISNVTRFEARAATDMHDIDDQLQVWSGHVRVYDSVAQQAGALWDALALHLPVRKRAGLAATHRAIALVHQTLLQGVADLADVESQVMERTTDVDRLSDELADLVAEQLPERPPAAAHPGVGAAIAQASQLSRLRRHSERVVADARRVKGQYVDLLASVANAFDERRVRELDVLQRGGHRLSVAVAGVTGVAILDFLFDVKNTGDLTPTTRHLITGVAVAIGVLLAYVVARNFLSVRKAQYITSWKFRRRYNKVLSYLRDSSTRELDRHPPAGRDPDDPVRDAWTKRDHALAERFAALWDNATAGTPPPGSLGRRPRQDIRRLARDIEQWTLRSLLLTERPRRLSRYRLPTLAVLYRHCVALDRTKRWETVDAVVADVDLEVTLEATGYNLTEARSIDHYIGDRTRARQAWARARPRPTAAQPPTTAWLLRDIERVLDSRTSSRDLDRANRAFVRLAVKWLQQRDVKQFIDIGAGLPDSDGVHQLARDADVIYVDHAPEVVAQGQVLLEGASRTTYIHADMVRDAEEIIDRARDLFDFTRPVAVLFTRVLGYAPDTKVRATLEKFRARDGLPSGAFIVFSHVAAGTLGAGGLRRVPTNYDGPHEERIRSRARIGGYFAHHDLEVEFEPEPERESEPGSHRAPQLLTSRRPGPGVAAPPAPTRGIHIYAGIARVDR